MARPPAIALWVAVSTIVLVAQDASSPAPQQPTFRTGIQSVRVDLYATRDGQPVTDLRRDEIRLLEDGAAQTIQTFERITYATPTSVIPTDPKTLEESRRLAADPRSRLFIVFVPYGDAGFALGPSPAAEARRLLFEPLNELLGPDDLIALMTPYTRVGDLTFYRRLPLNETRFFSQSDETDPKHLLWDVCYPPTRPGSPNSEMKARHQEMLTFEALDALVAHLGGLREERKQILLVTDGFRLFTENPALAAKGDRASPGFPVGRGPEGLGTIPRRGDATVVNSDAMRECDADLNAMASLNHRNRLEELATLAGRNNVSFSPVSLARMQTRPGSAPSAPRTFENTSSLAIQSSLRGLAEDTGGMAIVNTNDIPGQLRQMTSATSAYYLLGYTPSNTALDGKFRRISVRIERPGIRVHARPGYVAARPPDVSRAGSRELARAPNAVEAAVASVAGSATRALHVRSSVWTRIWIVGELPSQPRSAQAARVAQITVQPPGGGAAFSRQADIAAGSTAFEFQLDEPLAPGEYSVRVSVSGPGTDPLREFVRLTVPEQSASIGEPIVFRRGPATAQRYVRTANPQFQRNERIRLELPTSSAETATATMRDSKGAALPMPVTVAERPDESGSWRWITAEVALAPLAPATYAVEVRQGSEIRVTAFRVVP